MISKKLKDIAEALQMHAVNNQKIDVVPDGWWTTNEYMDAQKMSQSTAQRHIRLLIKKKKLNCEVFRIRTGGRVYPVPHYKTI